MTSFAKCLSALVGLLLFMPVFALADTTTQPPFTASITSQLAELQTQLDGILGTTSPIFLNTPHTLAKGQTVQEPDNAFAIGLTNFAHTGTTTPPTPHVLLGEFILEYNSCATSTSTSCRNSNHAVPSQLALGQSTNYLGYDVILTDLSSTTATIIITNQTLLNSFQNQLNGIANDLRMLIGS